MKKILVIAPVMPEEKEIKHIAHSLRFLQSEYQMEFIDPLSLGFNLSDEAYFQLWQDEIAKRLHDYDAFMGFSLGGVILQESLLLFKDSNKPVFLFSTPSFASEMLQLKLMEVISLCKQNEIKLALKALYSKVFIGEIPASSLSVDNETKATHRLIFGLSLVLNSDTRATLKSYPNSYWLFIGQQSELVSESDIVLGAKANLIKVPKSGMRVLQDNSDYCQKIILEQLKDTLG